MDAKTTHQLDCCARAEVGEVAVHEGLRLKCPGIVPLGGPCPIVGYQPWVEDDQKRWPRTFWAPGLKAGVLSANERDVCGGTGWVANPDPMALIAACHAKGWNVNLLANGEASIQVEKGMYGYRNGATLHEAVLEATLTVADNLERCFCDDGQHYHPESDTMIWCERCAATGYLCGANVEAV